MNIRFSYYTPAACVTKQLLVLSIFCQLKTWKIFTVVFHVTDNGFIFCHSFGRQKAKLLYPVFTLD